MSGRFSRILDVIGRSQRTGARWSRLCFRWRGYLPLLLIPGLAAGIANSQFPLPSHSADQGWEVGCLCLALFGLAVRIYTVGVAAPGTSGRGTRRPKAATLNTTGPYSVIRHPLYFGNFLVATGFALFTHSWLVATAVPILAIGYYTCIARYEEAYLRARFGSAFESWASRVPAMRPTFASYVPSDRVFAWPVAAWREFYTLTLILVLPMFLDMIEDLWEPWGELPRPDPIWTITASIGVSILFILRALKRRRADTPGTQSASRRP